FPPILGSKSRPAGPIPAEPFEAGMTVVVQPNVVTRDGTAGGETGELLLITDAGGGRVHSFPRGLARVWGALRAGFPGGGGFCRSCAGLTRASIHLRKKVFEGDGLPGHKRVHAHLPTRYARQ